MTVEEEFVMALFNPSVVSNASRMFKPNFEYNGHKDRLPIDLYDMNFRLYKPTPDYVNFEFYTSCSIGSFFMPIALIDKELNIFLINEFISVSYTHLTLPTK